MSNCQWLPFWLPFEFGLLILFFLGIGLRGLIMKQPFLLPARAIFFLMLVCFLPQMLGPLLMLKGGSLPFLFLLPALFFVFFFLIIWKQLQGYLVLGVTESSLREALFHALKRMGMRYEETLSAVRLLDQPGEIRVAFQSGMGSAMLRGQGLSDPGLLPALAAELRQYFDVNPVETNRTIFILYLVIGIFLAAMLVPIGQQVRRGDRICRVPYSRDISRYPLPPQLTNPGTIRSYQYQYLTGSNHKAFAFSSDGPYGYCYGKPTEEQARECALGYCDHYRQAQQAPCLVISVDGQLRP